MIRFANALGYRRLLGHAAGVPRPPGGALGQLPRAHRPAAPQAAQRPARARRRAAPASWATPSPSSATWRSRSASRRCERAVKLIAGAGRIHVLAQRRAFPVACYLAYALGQLELHDAPARRRRRHAARAACAPSTATTCCWSASFRSYSPEVVEPPQTPAARGVPVIAITDSPLSPLVRRRNGRASSWRRFVQPFRSLVAPLCLAQALVVSTGHHWPKNAEPRRRAQGQGMKAAHASSRPISTLDLPGPRRGRSLWRADRRPAGGHADLRKYLGGSPANTAVGAARLGLKPAMLTRVGDEHNGRFVRETLARRRRRREPRQDRPEAPHRPRVPRHPGPRDLPAGVLPRQLRRHGARAAERLRRGVHRFGHRACWSRARTCRSPRPTRPAARAMALRARARARASCWTSTIARCSGA